MERVGARPAPRDRTARQAAGSDRRRPDRPRRRLARGGIRDAGCLYIAARYRFSWRRGDAARSAAADLRCRLAARSVDGGHAASDRQARTDENEAVGLFDQHGARAGGRRGGAGLGAAPSPAGGSSARRVRGRADGPSGSPVAGECPAGPAPWQRDDGNADRDGRFGRQQRPGGARRPAAAHAGAVTRSSRPAVRILVPTPSPRSVAAVMRALARAIDTLDLPAVEKIAENSQENAFEVLIATMLSAQTRDAVTASASERLFRAARTPAAIAKLTEKQIVKLIFPVSFYRHKAAHVKQTCRILVDRFDGRIPDTMEELLTLPGVGRKTANLVLILSFRSRKNICVDTHVHRISNRLGWVGTRTPEETERALYDNVERRWWPYINLYLVTWGQNICRPIYPRSGVCVVRPYCPQIGVTKIAAR